MSKEINKVKSAVLLLFEEGKSEVEAFENISESHKTHPISLNQVKKWFKKFRTDENNLNNIHPSTKSNFTDEFLIKLINENPELNLTEIAKLSGVSVSAVSSRYKLIKVNGEKANYIDKRSLNGTINLTDESLIKLVKENPSLNTYELAKIANTSQSTICRKLKKINSTREGSDKVILQKDKTRLRSYPKKISDEGLIKLVNENSELKMKELAKLAGISESTAFSRIKLINNNGKKVNYIYKTPLNGTAKLTNESLIKLVKENPDLSTYELAKIANTSQPTIYRKLKKINSSRDDSDKINLQKDNVKLGKYPKKITDEALIKLASENPELSMRELAKLAGISQPAISIRLKIINSNSGGSDKIKLRGHPKKLCDEALIKLVSENPESNMTELAKIAGISQSNICRKLKKINSSRDGGDKIKLTGRPKNTSDKALIKLVSENPELNMTQLAKLAGISQSTIYRKLKKINNNEEGSDKTSFQNDITKSGKRPKKISDEALIELVNENPELSTKELAKLVNISQYTVSRRLKIINSNMEDNDKVILQKNKIKLGKHSKKITDEALIKLVSENPELNMRELAKLAGISQSTLSIRLKLINSDGEKVKYVSKK